MRGHLKCFFFSPSTSCCHVDTGIVRGHVDRGMLSPEIHSCQFTSGSHLACSSYKRDARQIYCAQSNVLRLLETLGALTPVFAKSNTLPARAHTNINVPLVLFVKTLPMTTKTKRDDRKGRNRVIFTVYDVIIQTVRK